jgi:predicted NAD/FAD-dependent oxidoreductase/deoxyribodipyrimidine photolyase
MDTDTLALLPGHLRQRSRALNAQPLRQQGEHVLYWCHHAVRDHDNPALDAACHLAAALGVPLRVYQGLGGAHRYNSDRHHAFILQGARELHAALRARGIDHLTSLPADPVQPSPLNTLLPRACALVVEDFPAPPFPRWTARWAARAGCATLAVDAACLVPMAATRRRYERAFAYRGALQAQFHAALDAPLVPAPTPPAWQGESPPWALDWARCDLDASIAACAIDHAVPPVADTPGGMAAGYARWEAFKQAGLRRYHQLRNDAAEAPPLGVSRLSPYLHHGHVSPWRIAREARAIGGAGADKFLDELWVWRKLAWQWCWHTADVEAPEAIPAWARASFAAHAGDARPPADDEALHAARSGEPLWDLAQTSLLRHGELHNNLRMTWGKALVGWSPTLEVAMRRLRDLNHRFALDGSDPASYGGLWWCLGLFDRPFTPAQPVLGELRARPLASHATRLDLARYAARVRRGEAAHPRVAVIGAGLAGAAAASALHRQGWPVQVIDKARGPGGRSSTRRGEAGSFDHGAQFLRAHDPRFRQQLARWADAGLVARWQPRVPPGAAALAEAWVAAPGMNALCRQLLDGIPAQYGSAVARLVREGGVWRLQDAGGALLAEAERVIVSAPAPQAAALLAEPAPALAARLAAVDYAPCWAAMVELPVQPAWDLLRQAGDLAWAAAQASRPGRPAGRGWLLQASAEASRRWLEDPAEDVGARLATAFAEVSGIAPTLLAAHRWRYALVEQALGQPCLAEADHGLLVAGDACLGGRLEAAWLSGIAAAGVLLRAAGSALHAGGAHSAASP